MANLYCAEAAHLECRPSYYHFCSIFSAFMTTKPKRNSRHHLAAGSPLRGPAMYHPS